MSTPLLEVSDLAVTVAGAGGPVRAVQAVSLELSAGETLALVGESGAGKSLTAQAIAGLLPRSARRTGGTVRLAGTDLHTLGRRQLRRRWGRELALVFQEPAASLNPVLDLGRQIGEAVRAHTGLGRADARERAAELLAEVGVPEPTAALRRFPHELAGGLGQRALLAIALANAPRLLIADEPTSALDVTVQAQILELLRRRRAATDGGLVLITHDLGVVAELADRVAVLYAGRIVEQAPVAELFADPRHPYTLGLLASRPRPDLARPLPEGLAGRPPEPGQLPGGCAFHPRCPIGADRPVCATELPPLAALPPPAGQSGEHRTACHFPDEVPAERARLAAVLGTDPIEPSSHG